jgi:hypothetical protein
MYRDFYHAARMFLRNPGFALAAIVHPGEDDE